MPHFGIDHVSIPVHDISGAARFYDTVLATIDLKRTKERDGAIGCGHQVGWPPIFWILAASSHGAASSGTGLHVSFRGSSREQVHAFHAAARAEVGRDAGGPGPRPHYTAGFYGAFAHDPTQQVQRKILLTQDLPIPGYAMVLVAVEIPPGGREGRHTHPGPLMAQVQEGVLTNP